MWRLLWEIKAEEASLGKMFCKTADHRLVVKWIFETKRTTVRFFDNNVTKLRFFANREKIGVILWQ